MNKRPLIPSSACRLGRLGLRTYLGQPHRKVILRRHSISLFHQVSGGTKNKKPQEQPSSSLGCGRGSPCPVMAPGSLTTDGYDLLTTQLLVFWGNRLWRLWDLWGNFPALGFVYSRPLNFLYSNYVLRTTSFYTTSQTPPLRFGELETLRNGWSQFSFLQLSFLHLTCIFPEYFPWQKLTTTRPLIPLLSCSVFLQDIPCSKLKSISLQFPFITPFFFLEKDLHRAGLRLFQRMPPFKHPKVEITSRFCPFLR